MLAHKKYTPFSEKINKPTASMFDEGETLVYGFHAVQNRAITMLREQNRKPFSLALLNESIGITLKALRADRTGIVDDLKNFNMLNSLQRKFYLTSSPP